LRVNLNIFNRIAVITLFACSLIFLNSCKDEGTSGSKDEGIIEFDTKAVDQTHPLSGLAPGSATLKYKREKFVIEMSTMGMFNTTVIGNTVDKTITQTVKFMDIKQACTETEAEIKKENASYRIKIEETKETKKILGYKCFKLKVTYIDNPTVSFDAWYTKDLGMENCNELTPYSQVKGVLLDYRVKKMDMEMRFVAKSIKNESIPDNSFEIPATMKKVDKATMAKFFADLQT